MKPISELRKELACLVPKPGVAMPSCHERTLCDCEVLKLLDRLENLEAANKILLDAMNAIETFANLNLGYTDLAVDVLQISSTAIQNVEEL